MDYPNKIGTSWHTEFWDRLNELVPDLSEVEIIASEKFANTCSYDDSALGRAECAAIEATARRKRKPSNRERDYDE